MIYTCKHFKIQELVPPRLYEQNASNPSRLWMEFDPLALMTLDALREQFGPTTVNNWLWGGTLKFRGFRPADCRIGAEFSQHRRGAAFDCDFEDVTAAEARMAIKLMTPEQLEAKGLQHIRRIEDGVHWFHFDTGNWVGEGIRFFKP